MFNRAAEQSNLQQKRTEYCNRKCKYNDLYSIFSSKQLFGCLLFNVSAIYNARDYGESWLQLGPSFESRKTLVFWI